MTEHNKKVLIIGSSKLPCPSTRGGAVPILNELLIKAHECDNNKKIELHYCSVYDADAEIIAKEKYPKTHFIWLHDSLFSRILDSAVILILKLFRMTKYINSFSYFFRIWSRKRKIKMVLRKALFDAVIFENSLLVLKILNSKKIRKKYEEKYFYHSHSVPHRFYGTKEILKHSAGIISVSNYLSNYFNFAYSPNYNAKKIVVKNCVDLEIFKRVESRKSLLSKYSIPENAFVLLYVGRIAENKGVMDIIKSLKRIKDEEIFLLVCGSSFYKKGFKTSFVKKVIKEAEEIKNNIVFTGYINNKDLPLFYSAADVLLSPSRCQEAAGLMNIEAMACGLPSITTDDGGIPEYVNDETSMIIHLDDQSDLSLEIGECVLQLKNDKELINEMRNNCLNNAKEFNLKRYYESFFKGIL